MAASGFEGIKSVTVKGLKPGKYRVHLTFANPTDEKRVFSIRLQGRLIAKDFSSGGKMIGVTMSFTDIESVGNIKLDLEARTGATQLSGIEIISMALPN